MKNANNNVNQLLTIPTGFEEMTEEEINKYYIIPGQQPDVAYIYDDDVFLSLKLNKENFTNEQLQEYKTNVFDNVFSKGTLNYKSAFKPELNQIHYSFETKKPQPPQPQLYIKAIAALHKNRLLNINFTCPLSKKEHWEPIISKSFISLKNE